MAMRYCFSSEDMVSHADVEISRDVELTILILNELIVNQILNLFLLVYSSARLSSVWSCAFMEIIIKLYGVFRIGRYKQETELLPDGCNVQLVVDRLELPSELLGIVLINGIHAGAEDILQDGDILSLLPVLDGG